MSEHDNSGTREERTNSLRDRIVPFTPETRELLRGWRVVFRPRGETRVSVRETRHCPQDGDTPEEH